MGYEDLANAIIEQAAKDYKAALLVAMGKQPTKYDMGRVISLEQFFRSKWYRILTDIDGEYLIEQIRKEVAEKTKIKGGEKN